MKGSKSGLGGAKLGLTGLDIALDLPNPPDALMDDDDDNVDDVFSVSKNDVDVVAAADVDADDVMGGWCGDAPVPPATPAKKLPLEEGRLPYVVAGIGDVAFGLGENSGAPFCCF